MRRITNHELRITNFRLSFITFIAFFVILYSLFAAPALAQVDTGLEPLTATGLGTTDVRVTIANIIRIFLGLLGVVGVALVLVGGFLWMTAAGNEEKIAKAKQLLTAAVIGLAIVLAAFTITSFILSRLLSATGVGGVIEGERGEGESGGGGRLPRGAFTVRSIQPQGAQTIRNLSVRLFFTKGVDPASVPGNVVVTVVSDGSAVEGDLRIEGDVVTFVPAAPCPAPNADRKCFNENVAYRVEAKARRVKSADGKELLCGIGGLCSATFTSGAVVDTSPPRVTITSPTDGQFVSVDTLLPIQFDAADDDGGIAAVDVAVSGVSIGKAAPPATTPKTWTGSIPWDTTGKAPGSSHAIAARVFDVDANATVSSTITVRTRAAHCFNQRKDADEADVDCGGNDCGTCTGGSCTGNDQCASGACSGGKCVEYPTITRVAPLDGAPGNLVTIFGRYFGTTPGTVTFLGGSGTGDDKTALAPSACTTTDVWRDDRLIVAVPEGAVAGPIKVTDAGGLYDDTANDRGQKAVFTPNEVTRPGLCSVVPNTGAFGTGVVVTGVQLGAAAGRFTIGGTAMGGTLSWSSTTIRGGTIPNLTPGNVDIVVTQGNASSNPLTFTVKELEGRPRILAIEPVDGPPGTYVTLRGSDLGTTGTVRFIHRETGKETVADTSFPQACATAFWTPTAVTIKVPGVATGAYDVHVVTTNDLESNSVPFTVNQRNATPGICRLDPDNGPVGLPVTVAGDRFGTTQGKVVFFQEKEAPIKKWEAQSLVAQVPLGATTGNVRVVDSTGTRSNTLPFTVRDCRSQGGCGQGNECCGDGVCRTRGTCQEAATQCVYQWKFTTGAGDGKGGVDDPCTSNRDCQNGLTCDAVTRTCQATIPTVVEEDSCTTNTQSPSPYRDDGDACTSATIAVRFTMNMHDASMENGGNVIVASCNTGERLKAGDCTGSDTTNFVEWIAHDTKSEGALYAPRTAFTGDTWYRVTLKGGQGGFQSQSGVLLDGDRDGKEGGDYAWFFHTATGSCTIDRVMVTPRQATIRIPSGTQDFTALPTAPNCNILDPNGVTWEWSSDTPTKATVTPIDKAKTTARAGETSAAETVVGDVDTPVRITATGEGKTDDGKLSIRFDAPSVVDAWPTCQAACANAEIGVTFSDSVVVQGGLKLFACTDAACTNNLTAVPTRSAVYNETTETLRTVPSAPLRANTYWRVVVDDVVGTNGKAIANANYDQNADGTNDAYSWVFKTKTDSAPCAVDRVTVEPERFTAYVVDEPHDYGSVAWGAPDECSAAGQRLDPFAYEWAWAWRNPAWTPATSPFVAVTNRDVLPKDAPDDRIDPAQEVRGKTQQENTEIAPQIPGGAQGIGNFSLVCGFTNDWQCPANSNLPRTTIPPPTVGVGSDTCCGIRPEIIETTPRKDETGVCRNAALTVKFNQVMDEVSLSGNIILAKGVEKCRDNCTHAVAGSGEAKIVHEHTIFTFTPKEYLAPNTEYSLQIWGDTGDLQQPSQAVRNRDGVALYDRAIIPFTTKVTTEEDTVCPIESVRVSISRGDDTEGPTVRSDDLFTCARSDCPDDTKSDEEGNQHDYLAEALSKDGQVLAVQSYTWTRYDPADIIERMNADGRRASPTPKMKDGEAEVVVTAEGKNDQEGQASATVTVVNFICENPWPSIRMFPWKDPDTNFSLFYCRDAGKPNDRSDDLPALQQPVQVPQPTVDVLKDLLLPLDKRP